MDFDRACPGGCIAAQLHPYSPVERGYYSAECELCGYDRGHKCAICKVDIHHSDCDKYFGKCKECYDEVMG